MPLPSVERPAVSPIHELGEPAVSEFPTGMLLNEADSTLTLDTLEGSRFIFDIRTGNVISSRRPARVAVAVEALAFAVLYGATWHFGFEGPRSLEA